MQRRVPEIEASEWIPRGAIGEFEIAEIGPKPQADARADWHDGDIVGHQRGHAEAADEIGGAVDAAEPFENRVGARQVVDQHPRTGAVRTGIEANARSLPEHTQIADIFRIEGAVAIAQAADKGAARFLAQNVAVWVSPADDRLFHDHGKPAGNATKKPMTGV